MLADGTLYPGIEHARIFGVGDSLGHDIAGAAVQGCSSSLVLTGIIGDVADAYLDREMARLGVRPTAIARRFVL